MSARDAAGVAGRPGRRPASGRLALWLRNRRRDSPGPCLGGRVVAWGLRGPAPGDGRGSSSPQRCNRRVCWAISLILKPAWGGEGGGVVIPIWQIQKLRSREVRPMSEVTELLRGCTANCPS